MSVPKDHLNKETKNNIEHESKRRWVSCLIPILVGLVALPILLLLVSRYVVKSYRVEGSAMLPTLVAGEVVAVNEAAYRFSPPQRGDLVVLQHPRDPSRLFIKRVIGLPGDEVSMLELDMQLFINDVLLDEPYIVDPAYYSGEWVVPDGEFFVLGDNRNNSQDSHSFGTVPQEMILGRVVAVSEPIEQQRTVPRQSYPELLDG